MGSNCSNCSGKKPAEEVYEVKRTDEEGNERVETYKSKAELDQNVLEDENAQVTKVKSSSYDQLRQTNERRQDKFTDDEFPPCSQSLGNIPGEISWKRIGDIVENPCLFDNKI